MRINDVITEKIKLREDASGIDFDMQIDQDTGSFATVTARAHGRTLGSVEFFVDGDVLVADQLEVDERYRGQGIAAAMYDYAKSQGYTIQKSPDLTPDGEHFWNKNQGDKTVWEAELNELGNDYMAGHCHVMAIALKMLHPGWQIRAHVGWEDDTAEDDEYRVDHVYVVAPDGSAYDCRGRFDSEEALVGEDVTGGFETQYADFDLADIEQLVRRGELKRFTREDINKAVAFAKRIQQ